MHKRILGFFHRNVEDAPLRIVQHVADGALARLRVLNDVRARADQLAHDAAVLHDADVMRNVCSARHKQRQPRNVADAAHGIELALALQRIDEGDAVHRIAAAVKLKHGGIDVLVCRQVKILGLERLAHKLRRFARNQHAAKHAFFRLQAVRQHPCRCLSLFHGKSFRPDKSECGRSRARAVRDAARRKPSKQGSARKPLPRQRSATIAHCGQYARPLRGISASAQPCRRLPYPCGNKSKPQPPAATAPFGKEPDGLSFLPELPFTFRH